MSTRPTKPADGSAFNGPICTLTDAEVAAILVKNECFSCSGSGTQIQVARVSGEAFDADWIETDCEDCDGTGTIEPECDYCSHRLDDNGNCGPCDDEAIVDTTVRVLANGFHRVEAA